MPYQLSCPITIDCNDLPCISHTNYSVFHCGLNKSTCSFLFHTTFWDDMLFFLHMNHLNAVHRGYYTSDGVDNILLHCTQAYQRTKIDNSKNWVEFWQRQAKWFQQKVKYWVQPGMAELVRKHYEKDPMTDVLDSHHLGDAPQRYRYRAKEA